MTPAQEAALLADVLATGRVLCKLPDSPGYWVGRLLVQAYLAYSDDLRSGTRTCRRLARRVVKQREEVRP
jgi:hypothetical protein